MAKTREFPAIEAPVSVIDAETASAALPEFVKVQKVDVKGKGQNIRFFALGRGDIVLSVKARGSYENIKAGTQVPVADVVALAPANEAQMKRYKGSANNTDLSLLAC